MKQGKYRIQLERQSADTILMVRPCAFGFNSETADTNVFQQQNEEEDQERIQQNASVEFDDLVEVLRQHQIEVIVMEDTPMPVKPDAVFPNNWITTHTDGTVITYPLQSSLRRLERRADFLDQLSKDFNVHNQYSFEHYEEEHKYLEGTGSMILDRVNHIVYACLSPRTDPELLEHFALLKQYQKLLFRASDPSGMDIYHTNVIMALGETQAVLCLDCIADDSEREALIQQLTITGKQIITISWDQVLHFAGNMLQVHNSSGDLFWIMSQAAFDSLDKNQIELLSQHAEILTSPIPTIEFYGGGSVRCMMSEIFLQRK